MHIRMERWRARRTPRRRGFGQRILEPLEGRTLLSTAAFAVTSDWGSGFGGQITITNTQPTAVSNWTLSFDWDRTITSIWDATVASHSGDVYTIDNAGWNATIPAGGSVSFGFNGSPGNVGNDMPTGYKLDGVAIGSVAPPSPPGVTAATASFAVTSDWGSGFGGQITITNEQSTPISNWQLAFNWDRTITGIWNATSAQSGDHYVITNAGYNGTIPAGGSVSFGFNGSTGNVGTDVPTNYVLNGSALGAGVPSVSIGNATVNDGAAGATAAFAVALSSPSTKTVTVKYATANGTAVAGTNYTAESGTLTFSPGTTSQTIDVPILPETKAGPNLTFQVALSSPANAGLATTSATGTIVDAITAPPSAGNVSTTTAEGTSLALNVLADASDPAGYTLTLASYTQPAHGAVTEGNGGVLTYTPAAGYLGNDAFTYTVSDGHGNAATGTVSVLVVAPSQASNWPAHVFAPYVDMTLYPTYNLTTAMQGAGLKYFTLAFITADANNAPAWGGYTSYEVNGGSFDMTIRSQIAAVRAAGGDVSVSFGGEAGTELAQAITSVSALTSAYQQVINAYGLTHIDFDIEGAAVAETASIDRRSQAIAALQATAASEGKTLDVSFTLPVLPSGLTANGLYVIQSALKYGVKISTVNVMAMDYGDSAAPNPQGQMGTYAIDAAESTEAQIASLYGSALSTSQLWEMIGVTPMIGVNDASDEVFEPSDATRLTTWAEQTGIGELAMWSLGRDQEDPKGALTYAEDDSSSIVQTPYEFSDILNGFTGTG